MAWDEDIDDDGGELDEWVDDDNPEDVLLHCPSCKQTVHEDTQQCPHCGDWITPVDLSDCPRQRIWLIAVILLIIAFTGAAVLIPVISGAVSHKGSGVPAGSSK